MTLTILPTAKKNQENTAYYTNVTPAFSKAVQEALREQGVKKQLRASIDAMLQDIGLTFDSLCLRDIQYTNGIKTWNGIGRSPEWMNEHIAAGGEINDFLIRTEPRL